MSTWTHVVGVIRFDGLAILGELEPDCGSTCSFEDDESVWDKCNVPCGSEGSLQISKWTNPDDSCLARYTYSIFGDLRNYGDDPKDDKSIIDYFNRIVKDKMIRQACFTFHVGRTNNKLRTFTYDNNSKQFMEL